MMSDLRYPVGNYDLKKDVTEEEREKFIDEIAAAPEQLRKAVMGLSDEQLDTPYRPDGWTIRQVIHHLADSHLNSYVRFRLALTEDEPTIKPYEEAKWADLADAKGGPVEVSLSLLESLHERWVMLLRSLKPEDFARTFRHPERGVVTLDRNVGLYAWHSRHHLAHITSLRERMNWN
jgi:hypothetical protein